MPLPFLYLYETAGIAQGFKNGAGRTAQMCVGGALLGGGGVEVAVVWVIHGEDEFLSLDMEEGGGRRAPLKATGWSEKLCICRSFPCVDQPISFEDN